MTDKPLVFDLSFEELERYFRDLGEPEYRASQLWEGIYKSLAASPLQITNLPMALREKLAAEFRFSAFEEIDELQSLDGATRKYLLKAYDGALIEVVLMRYERRRTACISTQVGCGMGCVFCATGQMGFQRHLTRGEIVEQVLITQRKLQELDDHLTNVVIMGMGEPFHNYAETMSAIKTLNDSRGFDFGARRFTVSTVGLIPMIERFIDEQLQVNLAISLHAATQELRDQLLPINARYPLGKLIYTCRRYVNETGRRITFEWALIDGVNDTREQAQALAELVAGMNCHVNLIPLNPTGGYAGGRTDPRVVEQFLAVLEENGISATVRVRRGIDIQAGCGQLATEHKRE
ncbi:MAG: 23S rRNA (adenine(2503)-C(2))-methyltransferase RlmN [Anaerolineales bacterium]